MGGAAGCVLLGAVILALAGGCIVWAHDDPSAKAGFLVYEPNAGSRFLVGEWERRDGFVDETEMAAQAPRFAQVSLRALPAFEAGDVASRYTYHMRIGIAGAPASASGLMRMALYAPCIGDFESLYIDGRLAYERVAGVAPSPLLIFTPDGDIVSIVLRSGPGDRRLDEPSLSPPILLFGEAGEVDRFQVLTAGVAIFEEGSFLLLGFVAFLLFLFWRKNKAFLGASACMLSAGLFYVLKNDFAFQPFLGSLRPDLTGPAYAAAIGLRCLGLAFFLWTIFKGRTRRFIHIAFLAAPALLTSAAIASSFLAIPEVGRAFGIAAAAYFALYVLAVAAWLVYRVARGDGDARWILPAYGAMGAAVAGELILPPSFASVFYLGPLGFMVFALASALMLIKKMGDDFQQVETLSDYVTSVAATVSSFIPREYLDYLDKSDVTDLRLGDHVKKEMTIFFSDIRAFTELSERLTVEENFAFINSYLSRMVPLIRENKGFVDKYLGDGVLALYPEKGGPDQAIRSAIAMQSKMQEYNGHRAKMGYCPISMGVGIHTGDLMLGVVGVNDRMENTVISDAVNLSSRLQAITKAFNITIAISEQSFKALEDPGAYTYRFIGKVRVKGKAAPIAVFDIFDGIAPDLFDRKMKSNMFFEQGMLSYYQKDFAGAMYYFKRVLDIIPEDGASGFYLDNCMNKAGK